MSTDTERAKNTSENCLDELKNLMDRYLEAGNSDEMEEAEREIKESVYGVGTVKNFILTLAGGGPAVRLFGELDQDYPATVSLQYQDWGTPWIDYPLSSEDEGKLLEICNMFYFGA